MASSLSQQHVSAVLIPAPPPPSPRTRAARQHARQVSRLRAWPSSPALMRANSAELLDDSCCLDVGDGEGRFESRVRLGGQSISARIYGRQRPPSFWKGSAATNSTSWSGRGVRQNTQTELLAKYLLTRGESFCSRKLAPPPRPLCYQLARASTHCKPHSANIREKIQISAHANTCPKSKLANVFA